MSSDMVRRRLVIHGKVQGVFFRDSIRSAAEREGVAGWAANRDDGAVEVVLEGPPAAVQAVAEYCRRGPERARVESVDEREDEPDGLRRFEIR
ncbi:MAG TPA: acylphosphatase [Solirubrobacteraceae bacterium]|nr:acylphosphatase [Solirubrobacteraceae bacterium]